MEYTRKQRTKFAPIEIIFKPVKRWDDIIDCYFSTDLSAAYRVEWSVGKNIRHARTFQCYHCNAYYIQKDIKNILKNVQKIPGVVYNFTSQNPVSFEDNIGNKGDLPLVAYMDFETTAPAENFLNPKQNTMFVVSYSLIFAFHPKLNLNSVVVQRSFGHSLLKLSAIDYLTGDQLEFVDKDLVQQLKQCAISVFGKKVQKCRRSDVCRQIKICLELFVKMVQ